MSFRKCSLFVLVICLIFALQACVPTEGGQVKGTPEEIIGGVLKGMGGQGQGQGAGNLSNAEVVSGLKEALNVGTDNAVSKTSAVDGYLANAMIKILLPEKIKQYEQALRLAGFGPKIDEFVVSMNRAAEQAAPYAKDMFWDAIKQITFTDAKNILFGPDDAATQFFRSKTENRLTELFKPIVHQSMAQVGVTAQYQQLFGKLNALTLGQFQSFDLDTYVTSKALDGLFLMVAQEEMKIRNNPVARVTEILRKVFGSK